jgi:putative FmdB family regulatory protein
MPLYEYHCSNCQARFEALRLMSQSDSPIACPRCADTGSRRVMSACATISKENGGSRLVTSSQSGAGCGACAGGHCASCGH